LGDAAALDVVGEGDEADRIDVTAGTVGVGNQAIEGDLEDWDGPGGDAVMDAALGCWCGKAVGGGRLEWLGRPG